ncbi:MAG: multidrug effflux MFS transporter [Gammaproteobacteria bacterium]
MTAQPPKNRNFTLAILIFSSATSVLSTDLYAPSLASLPEYFGTSAEMVKLTMTLNVLMYAIFQLVYGPLSDRFGRRPILIGGMAAFTLAGLACGLAQSIEQLIIARVFQGIAGAAEAVVVYAIIRDLYAGADRIRAIAIFGIIFGAAPAVAPLLGGYIHVAFGWRANFYLLTVIAFIALLLVVRFLPESTEPDRHAIRLGEVGRSYRALLADPVFMGYAVLSGTSLGAIYAFLTAGPFIFINNFGVATEDFGLYYFFIVGGYIFGSFLINRLAHVVPPVRSLWFGVCMLCAGAAGVMWLVQTGLESPVTITAGMCLMFFGAAPIFAIAPSRALDATVNRAGYASALLGGAELAIGGLAAAAITVFHDETSMPLAITLVGMAVTAVITLLWVMRAESA